MSDANAARFYVLDMGSEKYGDCILGVFPGATVLIDGGRLGDDGLGPKSAKIPKQLEAILGHPPPFNVSLLVVTHCHSDHIGCLPEMVAHDQLTASWALVQDEDLGFGPSADGGDGLSDEALTVARIAAALAQEPHDHLSDDELNQFMRDALDLPTRYRQMLARLEGQGTRVVRIGKDDLADLAAEFAGIGLRVLGPTDEQLKACAAAIAQHARDTADALGAAAPADETPADTYRRLVSAAPASDGRASDAGSRAKNDMSIVLKLGKPGAAALLPGDMQFADPMVPGIEQMMAALVETVHEAGPYDLVKLAHHTSDNGLNETVYAKIKGARYFAHSGGRRDAGHPDPVALHVLAHHQGELEFGRTDRNGLLTYVPGQGLQVAHGALNDFTPNA